MSSSKPFYVDGLTVQEILNLGDDILSRLDTRELSRALRTVSLAANKRIKRLEQYAYKRGKKAKYKKNRNEIYQELARARRFMNAKTSTVKGAKQVRQERERALFGKTREEMTKGMTKKEKAAKIKEINDLMPDVYEAYEDFQDSYAMQGGYNKDSGSMILQDIGKSMLNGQTPEEAIQTAAQNDTARYEGEQASEPDFWEELNGPKEEWENW